MSDPDSFFNRPGRPDHPDFWVLSDIVLKMDADATEGGKSVPEILATIGADPEVVTYFAMQRSLRATTEGSGFPVQVMLAGIFVDAFTLGARFAQKKANPDA